MQRAETSDFFKWWVLQRARRRSRQSADAAPPRQVNHGVPRAAVDRMLRTTDALFALPLETKLKFRPPRPEVFGRHRQASRSV
jgi:hypothetical protein